MRIVIFGGTTEGRLLSRDLAKLGAEITVCVATDHGREEQGNASGIRVLAGRKDTEAMAQVVANMDLCIDATHPYAAEASRNIRTACSQEQTPYLRLLRQKSKIPEGTKVFCSAIAAADWLRKTAGNILLTTGTKSLGAFASLGGERLYPRVLPLHESLSACEAAGIPHSNILALQGPFTQALNEALIRQLDIRYLVTKDGGQAGGFAEKAAAAAATGVALLLIQRPEEDGLEYDSVLEQCREMMECR